MRRALPRPRGRKPEAEPYAGLIFPGSSRRVLVGAASDGMPRRGNVPPGAGRGVASTQQRCQPYEGHQRQCDREVFAHGHGSFLSCLTGDAAPGAETLRCFGCVAARSVSGGLALDARDLGGLVRSLRLLHRLVRMLESTLSRALSREHSCDPPSGDAPPPSWRSWRPVRELLPPSCGWSRAWGDSFMLCSVAGHRCLRMSTCRQPDGRSDEDWVSRAPDQQLECRPPGLP